MRLTEPQKNQLNEFLRKYGYDIIYGNELNPEVANQARTNGATPLLIAALNGHTTIAKLLLDNRADVNKANADGATPLLIAALNGHTAIAQLLIDRGADVSKANNNGITPLLIAAQEGHVEIANLIKKQIIRQILPKINLESVCCISYEVISEDGTINGKRSYSTGGQHLYQEESIREWLRLGGGRAFDPMTKKPFRAADLIDLTDEIKQHFAELKAAKARLLEEVDTQPDYLAELITKLESLSSLPGNVTKNDDGTYHYDAGNGAAALAEKPLNQLTEDELTELNHEIEARLAWQQAAAQEAEQAAEDNQQDPTHVARLAERRAQEEARGAQPNDR